MEDNDSAEEGAGLDLSIWWPDVIGVSLLGPPPLGEIHLRWQQGVHVLYGVNGAGKTATLEGLRRAFQGRRIADGRASLHVRLRDPHAPLDWDPPDHLAPTNAVLGSLAFSLDDPDTVNEDEYVELADLYQQFIEARTGAEAIARAIRFIAFGEDRLVSIADDIGEDAVFTLEAIGDTELAYEVWVSVRQGASAAVDDFLFQAERGMGWPTPRSLLIAFSRALGIGPGRIGQAAPPWVPVPICRLGNLKVSVAEVITESLRDADRATQLLLAGHVQQVHATSRPDPPADRPPVVDMGALEAVATRLSHLASTHLERLLVNAPALTLTLDMGRLLSDEFARWRAIDRATMSQVPLQSLSRAQQRWAGAAIQLALQDPGVQPRDVYDDVEPAESARPLLLAAHIPAITLLIDEPESGLHPQAVDHLVEGVAALTSSIDAATFVATHEPRFLDHPSSRLLHVYRATGDGLAQVSALAIGADDDPGYLAEKFGIPRAALLQRYRVFLLVEGAHDESVLNAVLGDVFTQCRVRVVPLRGARRVMNLAEAEILLDFTDARLVVALDNVTMDKVQPAFSEATDLAHRGDIEAAVHRLHHGGERRSFEEKLMFSLLHRAITTGSYHRLVPFGFLKHDIIEYLPVESLVPGAASWEELAAAYRAARRDGVTATFKNWLRETRGAKITVATVRAAAETLDELHPDFQKLADIVCRPAAALESPTGQESR